MSVIIATYNRASSLREVLNLLAHQVTEGRFTYEVVVVDNNSTDGTEAMVKALQAGYPAPLRYVFEPRQGKSNALNRALAMAQGEFIAFTDDDTQVPADWLSMLHQTFTEYAADGVGGPVRPVWIGSRPQWLGDALLRQLGMVDYGPEPFRITSFNTTLIGPNCAYRKTVFARYGGYDPAEIGSEDAEWFLRVFKAGCALVYQPRAAVGHQIDARYVTKRTIARRLFQHGPRSAVGLQRKGGYRAICRVPLWVVSLYISLHWQAAICWLRGDSQQAWYHWLRRYLYLGIILTCLKGWWHRQPISPKLPPIVSSGQVAS